VKVLRRLRFSVIILALPLIAVMALIGAFIDAACAKGTLLGGVAGCAVFLLWIRFTEKALVDNRLGKYVTFISAFFRLGLYALVLGKGYYYDPVHWHGFFGAVAGLAAVYVAVGVVGFTGWDLKRGSE
jgi:hypothetical protein